MRTQLLSALIAVTASPLLADVVVNEIMYHPQSENSAEEYIELHNTSAQSQDLSGWKLTRGVEFTFPAGATISAGGYLVVAADAAAFNAKYPTVTNFVAGWTGKLSNSSNTIRLEDAIGTKRDEIEYSDDGDWGQRRRQDPSDHGHRGWVWRSDADGFGKSLELINPAFDRQEGQNWKASSVNQGTPGAANSVAAANIAPVIDKAAHFPWVPRSTDNVTITCRVRDDQPGAVTVKLFHRVDGAASFSEVVMRDDGAGGDPVAGDGLFTAVLLPEASGTVVEFYFSATDAGSLVRTWPAPARDYTGTETQSQNCLYLVDDAVVSGTMPLYRLIMRAADRAELSNINTDTGTPPFPYNPNEPTDQTHSHARFNATFISRDGTGTKVRYLAGARNRGNGSRSLQPQSFNVQFANADAWNGRVAIALNTQNTPFQLFGSALYRRSGLAAPESRAVQLRVNTTNPASGSGAPSYGFYVCNEVQDSEFADRQFPQDSSGNIYRAQRFFKGTTAGGTVIQNAADLALHTPAAGETLSQVDLYKLNYRKETNISEDNWGDLIGVTEALAKGQSGATINDPITYAPDYLTSVQAKIDIEQFVRWFAVETFADNEETNLSNGDGDDYYLYIGATDPRARLVPYDLDTILGRSAGSNSATHGIFRMVDDPNTPVKPTPMNAFIKHPAIAPLYYGELKRLLDGPFNPAELDPFCDAVLGSVAPVSVLDTIKTFNAARHAHITTLVPLNLTVTSALPLVNGIPQATTSATSLTGRSHAVNTRSVKVNGVSATWIAWSATWNAANVALNPGINRVLVQAFDGSDAEIDRAYIDIWYQDGTTQSVSGSIAADTTWTAANGPYQVTAALTVPAGVTLTIQPGTSVLVAAGVTLTVSGRILAEGTETKPIYFGPVPGAANWGRIAITNTTVESRIAHAYITGNGSSAIRLSNAIAVLDHLNFGNPAVKYLDLDGSSFVVSNCVFPSPSVGLEPVHGTGGIMAGGRGIIRDCFFGRTIDYNDTVDFTGGNRPGPILQVLNCVFTGSDDDLLDLDGTDTWVEGNIFMHCHRHGSPDSSSAVSGGSDSGQTSEITIVGNLFYDVDQAMTGKQGNFYTMLNNTVVDQNGRGSDDAVNAVVNLADEGITEALGAYLEGNIIHSAEGLMRNYNPALSTVTWVNNILPMPWTGPGSGNVVSGALLNDPFDIPTPNETNWRQLVPVLRQKFSLQGQSPGRGAGPNGTDLGGVRPLGVSIGGAPQGTTNQPNATLTIGTLMTGNGIPATATAFPNGSGWTHYKWRLDGAAWSAETAINVPITLADLSNGAHTVDVVGRNDAGFYQDHSDFGSSGRISSATWTVDRAYVPPPGTLGARISEVLAQNTSTINFGTAFPDIIELQNTSGAPVNLAGWGLTDNTALPFKYTFPAGTSIPAGGFLAVYASGNSSVPQPKTGFGLKREGDTLTLTRSAAAGGGIADQVAFGYQIADRSIGRAKDGSWRLCMPTFGSVNVLADTAPADAVRINEWLAEAVTQSATDFVELYNPGSQPADIGNGFLSDNPAAWPDHFHIRQLSFIPARGYAVFKADDDEGQGPDHLNFELSPLQGELALFDPQLRTIDNIVYGPQRPDVSEGRSPNGANSFLAFSLPTPGGPNASLVSTTTQVTQALMPAAHSWKYFAATGGPANDGSGRPFTHPQYDDASWSPAGATAAQLLYIESSSLTNAEGFAKTTVLPGYSSTRPYQTYYFRTHFNYTGSLNNVVLTAKVMIDDGAVIYLNGFEAKRVGVDSAINPVVNSTLANRTPDNAVVEVIDIPVDHLVQGDNVIAVSVHQVQTQSATAGSSDIVWGMKLDATSTFGGTVVLNEVLASNATLQNPSGSFAGWIEVRNNGPDAADLSDMSLSDSITQPRKYVFPAGTALQPGAMLVVECNGSSPASGTNTGYALNTSGGAVALYHSLANGGGLHDSVVYGRQVPDFSIGRSPDGTGDWTLCVPTRTAANTTAILDPASAVRVNEWSAAGAAGTDFVELFNTGTHPVELGGIFLSDDLVDRARFQIPPLTFIGATGASRWQKWVADNDNSGTLEHVNFDLGATGDVVGLFDSGGYSIDIVGFGAQQVGRSGGRFPDGGAYILVLNPTPGAANQLVPGGDTDGDGITDAWELANGLNPTSSLDAMLDSDGDGQSNVAEFVSGTDPLSSGDFLHAQLITTGGNVAIRFTAVAGKTYSVQYKNDLVSAQWSKLVDVPPGGQTVVLDINDSGNAGQLKRFYRVITPAVP